MSKKNAKQYYIAISEYEETRCSPRFTEDSMGDVLHDFFEETGLDIDEISVVEIGSRMKVRMQKQYSLEKLG